MKSRLDALRIRWTTVSLGTRFVAVTLGVSVIGFLVFGGLVANMQFRTAIEAMTESSQVQAAIIADNANAALSFDDAKAGREILSTLRAQPSIELARLRSLDGGEFATYRRDASVAQPWQPELKENENHAVRGERMYLRRAVEFAGRPVGVLELWVDLSQAYSRLWSAVLFTLLTALLIAIGTALVAAYFQKRLAHPLRELLRTMQTIRSDRDYSVRAPIFTQDEVATFATGFNEILDQVKEQQRDLQIELAERTEAEHRLAHIAHHDAVTGLPNRHHFSISLEKMLAQSLEKGRGLAVMFIDLDNFKYVNDSLGHHAGDLLLHAVAARLQSGVRKGDVLCRIGGDEFALVAEGIDDQAQIAVLAEKIIAIIKPPFDMFGEKIYVGASAGIARAPFDGIDPQTLLRNADAAMYHAKERGKNNFQFYLTAMNERFSSRFKIESALRDALAREEFFLLYQPEIDLASGYVLGCEALIRWRDSEGTVHAPDEFLPIAEDAGLDNRIGEWVLDTACAQLRKWRDAGIGPFTMAVNMSGREMSRQPLPEIIAATMARHRIEPGQLEIEITESTLVQDPERCVETLRTLKKMGVNIAVDDFGVGYSSLGYLRRFPIDKLKIDKSFIRDVPHNADSSTICDAIIALASALKMTVLAEGVEESTQLDYLKSRGCAMAQGYYWSKPVPPDKFAELFAHQALPSGTVVHLNALRISRQLDVKS